MTRSRATEYPLTGTDLLGWHAASESSANPANDAMNILLFIVNQTTRGNGAIINDSTKSDKATRWNMRREITEQGLRQFGIIRVSPINFGEEGATQLN